jgi:aryl sulfotransferase
VVERAARQQYVNLVSNNNRWDGFVHRAGDIFVCTPAKVGTTWTQGIVRSLINGADEPVGTTAYDTPWLDARFEPLDVVLERLAAQTKRRCIKSHTPADGIPLWADAFYIAVYRPGRDAFMSWVNHITNMRFENMGHLFEEAIADGVELGEGPPSSDVHDIFAAWVTDPPQLEHFDTWWPLRGEPNVRILHYDDLLADLPGEMRRLAAWLGIEIDEAAWPRMVERCSIDEMRAAHAGNADIEEHFIGGAATFFNKGTNGRWVGVLTDDELVAYDEMITTRLGDEERAWFEAGSLATGHRPEDL